MFTFNYKIIPLFMFIMYIYHCACTSIKNPQTEQIVLELPIGFSFIKICFLILFRSRNFVFIVFENQAFNVSIINQGWDIQGKSGTKVFFSP